MAAVGEKKVDVEIKVPPGTVISTKLHDWTIDKVLGKGGFGCVYLVKDRNNEKIQGAMKVERFNVDKEHNRLGVEARLLTAMRKAFQPHLLWAMDAGTSPAFKFKFLVMPLVGRSIDWLMENMTENGTFSRSTALKIVIQMMEAIRNLHEIGVLHRDIKPANFAIGYRNKEMIHMLDYGLARYYRGPDGFLARPRIKKKFIGTLAYASRAMHKNRESSRADDVEQWFYTMFEIFGKKNLMPWFKTPTNEKQEEPKSGAERVVADGQEEMRQKEQDGGRDLEKKQYFMKYGPRKGPVWAGMPQMTYLIGTYIKKLSYYSRPDYSHILILLGEIATVEKYCKMNEPFDWMKPQIIQAYEKREQMKREKERKEKEQEEKEREMLNKGDEKQKKKKK